MVKCVPWKMYPLWALGGEMGLIVSEIFALVGGGLGQTRSQETGDRSTLQRSIIQGRSAPWRWLLWGAIALGPVLMPITHAQAAEPPTPEGNSNPCGPAVLDRLVRHRLAAGETVESLASRYNLLPSTLLALNPNLRGGQLPKPGTEILIAPINGIRVETQPGDNWQSIAQQYRVRADSLFTVNGCQAQPGRSVFVPGVLWSPIDPGVGAPPSASDPDNDLLRYPLSEISRPLTDFGWQVGPTGAAVFNSYITLEARPSAVVLAVGPGTVAFVGPNSGYPGQLVVVNHQGGRQTRYANLGATSVQRGQRVNAGSRLGTIPSRPANGRSRGLWFEVRYNSSVGWVAQNPGPYLQRMEPARSTPPNPTAPTGNRPSPRPSPPRNGSSNR